MAALDPDHALREAGIGRARELSRAFDDLVPISAIREGFWFQGERISFGSFQKGIHRARQMRGDAALTVVTSVSGPYDDELDSEGRAILYHYRAGSVDQADNRALLAAFEQQVPLIYFHGVDRGQYLIIAPVFVTADDRPNRCVLMEIGLPISDLEGRGLMSPPEVRDYALREVRIRLHQQRFRRNVLRAYRHRCTVCSLRERDLVQAAHIVSDLEPEGAATVVNGLALCAIHHLAYDRNLLGIDPGGVVHIAKRLRDERDGPMLREGLQGFHGGAITLPHRTEDQPEPARLEWRFERFRAAS
jgi:putative restriction endonuclease